MINLNNNSNEPIVQAKNLSFKYAKDLVLENITLDVPKGAFLAIVGPNGSGKSTLLKLFLGLNKLQKGSITLFGESIQSFKDWQKVGFVSQKANSFNTGFPATVFEVVESGLTKKIGLFKFVTKEHKQKVKKALEAVDMLNFQHRSIGELSGGQQQRVFIARSLVSEPVLMILDEPTVGVDSKNVHQFYEMLEMMNKQLGITLILVTHDVSTVSDKVTHVACLNKNLHFHGDAHEYNQLTEEELSEVYGHDIKLLSHNHE
ncbi:metal ABC transporter ATP-binding protein [Peribacillus psychrosaccharolyticus]|uniref:metal ABC transporter ATP-binding protein n=1 Tax=Peribacillus psychrosaccharolyticus TaxID=1407 RepID=UPI00031A9FE2|nr:metal ABC transporter ATP-binding protein [Peribacillus psychrosaccharolyticus]MEC2054305.1 metal ABC transporter ATP-binding protein [Peribacillus psychrosaccharolyticus]MED3744467.1 metal ABC transporter ATP-binding protein [Peribacillus psychrosaccharolyticus]